jgi:thiol-disulfide isomerase/thioredoxin
MKNHLRLAVAALLLSAAFAAAAQYETEEPVDFTLQQLGGGPVSLSDYRGEWVVVNYWATWCAPCRKEMPELSALHDERRDVTVLGLAYEDVEDNSFESFLAVRGPPRAADHDHPGPRRPGRESLSRPCDP